VKSMFAVVMATVFMGAGLAMAQGQGKTPQDKIIISGASGGLAGETVEALLARGVKASDLILVSRSPDKLADLAAKGATVRQGDFDKPESLPAAFAGGARLLLVSTSGGDRVKQHTNAIEAAKKAGVKQIAYTSFVNAVPNHPAALAKDHIATEAALKKSGVPYTLLRNQLYSDGLINQGAQAIATGEIVTNWGNGKWAPVTRKDCAAAAAAVLSTPGHENKTYDITGPDLISQADFAKLLADVSGKPVKVTNIDDATLVERMKKSGTPEGFAKWSASLGTSVREGFVAIQSNDVQKLTGKAPQSVRTLLTANRQKLTAAPAPRS
jgi:NAD(P)H dehydrogenase (quinone)